MSNTEMKPDGLVRRSFIYRKFNSSQVTWSEINGYMTVSLYNSQTNELEQIKNLALCDLIFLQRIGFKGPGTCKWLENNNISIPAKVNTSLFTNEGCIIARLGENDVLILDNLHTQTNLPNTLEQQWLKDYSEKHEACGFIMPRQDTHACFSITGNDSAKMFAKLCAVDLRSSKFDNQMIAQTSLARLSVIIIRQDLNQHINFLVLVESASAEYCWDSLVDAMQEFNGQIIGVSTLADLA
jgi:sarcosine oxidase subunit gamma